MLDPGGSVVGDRGPRTDTIPGLVLQLLPQLQCWARMGALPVIVGLERHATGPDATAFATAAVLVVVVISVTNDRDVDIIDHEVDSDDHDVDFMAVVMTIIDDGGGHDSEDGRQWLW